MHKLNTLLILQKQIYDIDTKKQVATMDMEIELKNVESLSKILARLAKLDDVIEAKRL